MTYRRIDPERDYGTVASLLQDYLAKAEAVGAKLWTKYIEADVTLEHLFSDDVHVYIVDETYLVFYEVGTPWYSSKTVLGENLVLALKPGKFSAVTDFLTEQAILHRAVFVAVGTGAAISDAALARSYVRNGFHQEFITLIKEV